jgi:hypothetical protein
VVTVDEEERGVVVGVSDDLEDGGLGAEAKDLG